MGAGRTTRKVNDNEPGRFTLAELEDSSGVPERTIRFYISNGLVSQARGKGRSRYFTSEHLRELEYVAKQRAQHFSIDEIRAQMVRETEAEPAAAGEPWERVYLHPALELSMRADAPDNVRALAAALRASALDWFGDDEPL